MLWCPGRVATDATETLKPQLIFQSQCEIHCLQPNVGCQRCAVAGVGFHLNLLVRTASIDWLMNG
jgi:hypothetical protein